MLETLLNRESIPASILKAADREIIKKRALAKDVVKILLNINLKTIRFNFTYFDFSDAIKFPVFVKRQVQLHKLGGRLRIDGRAYPGMILLGYGEVGHFDKSSSKLIWEVAGEVVFKGPALLKFGSKIVVNKEAYLEFGNKFRISPNSAVICYKKIVFGDNCRISWDATIMDTDFHKIKSLDGEYLNPPKEIVIGDHVWIGAKASVMKGAEIPDDCIVATGSIVTKSFEGRHQILAGIPAKVVKTEVTWEG